MDGRCAFGDEVSFSFFNGSVSLERTLGGLLLNGCQQALVNPSVKEMDDHSGPHLLG